MASDKGGMDLVAPEGHNRLIEALLVGLNLVNVVGVQDLVAERLIAFARPNPKCCAYSANNGMETAWNSVVILPPIS